MMMGNGILLRCDVDAALLRRIKPPFVTQEHYMYYLAGCFDLRWGIGLILLPIL